MLYRIVVNKTKNEDWTMKRIQDRLLFVQEWFPRVASSRSSRFSIFISIEGVQTDGKSQGV